MRKLEKKQVAIVSATVKTYSGIMCDEQNSHKYKQQ